jgi:2-methylcitrate dehydratase
MDDGTVIADEMAVANAHPLGAKPFARADYVRKFRTLTEGIVATAEADRFIAAAERAADLKAGELGQLNVALPEGRLARGKPGLF